MFPSEGQGTTKAGTAEAIEAGRNLARDVGSGDPERMAAPRLAELVQKTCKEEGIEVHVIDDQSVLASEYPLHETLQSRGTEQGHLGNMGIWKCEIQKNTKMHKLLNENPSCPRC